MDERQKSKRRRERETREGRDEACKKQLCVVKAVSAVSVHRIIVSRYSRLGRNSVMAKYSLVLIFLFWA